MKPVVLDIPTQLEGMLDSQEGEHLEFKEARNHFERKELARYCCAMANEGGGSIILGITDKRPRRVVGTSVFRQFEDVRRYLLEQFPLNIEVREINHPDGRVLLFEVQHRPLGTPIKFEGIYWARKGDGLVHMPEDRLRLIFAETGHDFSADICPKAEMTYLDPAAIQDFRRRWLEKSNNGTLKEMSDEQLLRGAELLMPEGLTYAALILFGTREALGRLLSQAEFIFEYRSSEAAGPAAHRVEYRQGFFSFYDDLWDKINLRNDLQHYREGLFILDIPTFAERSVRETILNAVSHRDYQLSGSVFVNQYPGYLRIVSPGGLPHGITLETILDQQAPRNRRIAEALARCGLVERAGQGMNLIFAESIRQGKLQPDFSGTDPFHVVMTLPGEVRDTDFVRFIEKMNRELQVRFEAHDFQLLDFIHREQPVPAYLKARIARLADLGIIERAGRGRGTRYLLSRRFYISTGQQGTYTRRVGLDREQNKTLLLKHLQQAYPNGCAMAELQQVVPAISREMIRYLLHELRKEGKVKLEGERKGARWSAIELSAKASLKKRKTKPKAQ